MDPTNLQSLTESGKSSRLPQLRHYLAAVVAITQMWIRLGLRCGGAQWLEPFHMFAAVQILSISREFRSFIVSSLQGLNGESVSDYLHWMIFTSGISIGLGAARHQANHNCTPAFRLACFCPSLGKGKARHAGIKRWALVGWLRSVQCSS